MSSEGHSVVGATATCDLYNRSGFVGFAEYRCDGDLAIQVAHGFAIVLVQSKFAARVAARIEMISSTGNVARVAGAIPADYFIRTGSNVLGSVSVHHNVLQGSVSSLFLIGSGTLNQTQNLHNGTIIP